MIWFMAMLNGLGDAAVSLNNYDCNVPIYDQSKSTRALVRKRNIWIQILGAPKGSQQFVPLSAPFMLTEDGFFDNGFGVLAGVPDNAEVVLKVLVWKGKQHSSYDTASCRAELIVNQQSGENPAAAPSPKPAALRLTGDIILPPDPARAQVISLLGGLVLLAIVVALTLGLRQGRKP